MELEKVIKTVFLVAMAVLILVAVGNGLLWLL